MADAIVPVLGMHRSGTSAVAGALHTGGIPMGPERRFEPRPLPENPRGFYEDVRFRRINDRLCRHNGYRIKSWAPPPAVLEDSAGLLARRVLLLLSNGRRFGSWGWKDPRTCLTFDLWAAALRLVGRLEDVHAVFVVRDPLAVAASLEKRDGLGRDRALDLWRTYNVRALRAVEAAGVPASFVAFSDLLDDPEGVLTALAGELPGLDPRAGADFVEPDYDRSSPASRGADASPPTPDHPALGLYEELRRRTR